MMWLGIVIHTSVNHMTGPMVVPWRDPDTSPLADFLGLVIHIFRMPVFLMLAGYFVAMLVERHGARAMLIHRFRRIALPFILFWPVLAILTALLVTLFNFRVQFGTWGLAPEVIPRLPNAPLLNTLHLWFLYQLFGFVLLTFVVLRATEFLPIDSRNRVSELVRLLGQRPWGFAVLALPLALIGAQYPIAVLVVTGSFTPPALEWIHHGLFYAFGYFLYYHRTLLLSTFTKRWIVLFWIGIVACAVASAMLYQNARQIADSSFLFRFVASWFYNAATWLWSFALIGFALRYLDRPNTVLRYLADSAYWVYLVHMLGTIGFGVLLLKMPVSAEVKMLINVLVTTIFCLLTYHYLVRNQVIGRLLNGKLKGKRGD